MRPGHSAPRALRAVSEHAPVPAPRACLAAALGAFSDNTRRAIRSDFGIFDAWCRARPLPALPAAPATLAAFVDAMAGSRAPATVRRYVASIAAAHRVLGHDRSEIDLGARTWTIPADHMKAGREHVVPLSDAAIAVVEQAKALCRGSELVFPGAKRGGGRIGETAFRRLLERVGVNAKPHGFRSSFRDWAAERRSSVPREVAELCLAHQVGNPVERSYRRSTLLDLRRKLMDDWAAYVTRKPADVESLTG